MRKLMTIVIPALLGAVAGSSFRQKLLKNQTELVIAAHPAALAAGTVAGFVTPRAKSLVALIVALNVASNYPR